MLSTSEWEWVRRAEENWKICSCIACVLVVQFGRRINSLFADIYIVPTTENVFCFMCTGVSLSVRSSFILLSSRSSSYFFYVVARQRTEQHQYLPNGFILPLFFSIYLCGFACYGIAVVAFYVIKMTLLDVDIRINDPKFIVLFLLHSMSSRMSTIDSSFAKDDDEEEAKIK